MPLYVRKTLVGVCLSTLLNLMGAAAYAKEGDETPAPESGQEEQTSAAVNADVAVDPDAEVGADAPSASSVFYKSVDAKGNITYTDTPPANRTSEALKMPATNSMPMSQSVAPARRENNQDNDHGEEKGPVEYTRFEIVSPANDTVLGQDVETATISVTLEPGLQDGHQLQLFYDGKPVGALGDLSFTVEGLERGTHTAEAKILDDKKRVLKSASKVQFYVYRHSILDGKGNLKDPDKKVPYPVPTGSMPGFGGSQGLDTSETGVGGGDKEANTPEEKKPTRGIPNPAGAKSSRGF